MNSDEQLPSRGQTAARMLDRRCKYEHIGGPTPSRREVRSRVQARARFTLTSPSSDGPQSWLEAQLRPTARVR
jgi:hypothetical protein